MGCKVALLTGRGGSSFKDKNIREIKGLETLKYPAISANKSQLFDWTFCSSDEDKILTCAEEVGFKKISRPPELGSATALHKDVINHALSEMAALGLDVDVLFVFLANNVCVSPSMITDAYKLLVTSDKITSVVPAYTEFDRHPLRSMKISPDGSLTPFANQLSGKKISSNRQELEPAIFLCHNFWAISLKKQKNGWIGNDPWPFLGDHVMPLLVDETYDIHDEQDLIRAEDWLERNNINYSRMNDTVMANNQVGESDLNSFNISSTEYIECIESLEAKFFSQEKRKQNYRDEAQTFVTTSKFNFFTAAKMNSLSKLQTLVFIGKWYLPNPLKRILKVLIGIVHRRNR